MGSWQMPHIGSFLDGPECWVRTMAGSATSAARSWVCVTDLPVMVRELLLERY